MASFFYLLSQSFLENVGGNHHGTVPPEFFTPPERYAKHEALTPSQGGEHGHAGTTCMECFAHWTHENELQGNTCHWAPKGFTSTLESLSACEGRDFSQDLFLVVCVMSSFKLLTWHNLEQTGKWISMKNYQVGRWACRWWVDVLIMVMGVGKTQPKSGQHHSVDLGTGLFLQGESKLSINSMRVFTPFCSWLWLRHAASAPCCPDLPAMMTVTWDCEPKWTWSLLYWFC